MVGKIEKEKGIRIYYILYKWHIPNWYSSNN
jgi:hypothetical protein